MAENEKMVVNMQPQTEAEVVASVTQMLAQPILQEFTDPEGQKHQVVILPQGKRMESLKRFEDEWRKTPERQKGTSWHGNVESFLSHVGVFKNEDSAVFASPSDLQIKAIYSYSAKDKPKYHDHCAVLKLQQSKEWKGWSEYDGKWFDQTSFALFMEDNITAILNPPDLTLEPNAGLRNISLLLNYAFATQTQMITLSRGIEINSDEKAKSVLNPQSGERVLQYSKEHKDGAGERLTVPGLFLVGLPVFDGGALYRLPVRLRYRLEDGEVKWRYDIHEPRKAFDDAFNETLKYVKENVGLLVYIGIAD